MINPKPDRLHVDVRLDYTVGALVVNGLDLSPFVVRNSVVVQSDGFGSPPRIALELSPDTATVVLNGRTLQIPETA